MKTFLFHTTPQIILGVNSLNSLIILGVWIIWKHRNACVFEGAAPSVTSIMREFKDEYSLWCLAGAKKLQDLELGTKI